MMKRPFFLARQQDGGENYQILYFMQGDVTGDGIPDNVYLVGNRPDANSPFTDNITLVVEDGSTGYTTEVALRNNAGYNPTLFLGDFTGDEVSDILIRIDSGGSGAFTYDYVYSFLNNRPRQLFDSEAFNLRYQYDVIYRDFYYVEIINKTLNKRYTVNIRYKGTEYLSEIYNPNGTLKAPINGFVNPISGLYPIDFEGDGIYELFAFQRVAGRYNADGLGYLQTVLKWDGREFLPTTQYMATVGEDIINNG